MVFPLIVIIVVAICLVGVVPKKVVWPFLFGVMFILVILPPLISLLELTVLVTLPLIGFVVLLAVTGWVPT